MDGENNGKPYFQMDDLGAPHCFWKHPTIETIEGFFSYDLVSKGLISGHKGPKGWGGLLIEEP